MSTIDILITAKSLLEERGWCQEVSQDLGRRLCALGAVVVAVDGKEDFFMASLFLQRDNNPSYETFEQVATALAAAVVPDQSGALSAPVDVVRGYNDTPGRTKEEILALFDAAIRARESEE